MRSIVGSVVVLALVACTGAPMVPSPESSYSSIDVAAQDGAVKQTGVAAHYVVESGTNEDGKVQLDVRPVQEPSIFKKPKPLKGVTIVIYPDGTTQRAGEHGNFDASASGYAQEHAEGIGGKLVRIRIASTSMTTAASLQPQTFFIYVPSAADEAVEQSYFRVRPFHTGIADMGPACRSNWPHRDIAPNDTAAFLFISPKSKRNGVYAEYLFSCGVRYPGGRILGYEWIDLPGSHKVRFTYRYQAPSRASLRADKLNAANEYLDLRNAVAPREISPRYDV